MRILIVDEDMINSSKLKLVFSKYGECETAIKGSTTLDMYIKSHDASQPYDFICVEMDMQEIKGAEVIKSIRKWEAVTNKPKARILLICAESDQETASTLEDETTACLLKPYDRKKLELLLADMDLEKIEEPKKNVPPPPQKTITPIKKIEQKELDDILNKITALVTKPNFDQFKQMGARHILEELVHQGGDQAALLMGQYLSSDKVSPEIRLELIQSAGKVLHANLLVPLNKVINSEENIKMIQEAFLAVAKFNNQRALNILNQGLQKFKHPMLLNTLRAEIAKIKQNKPVLAILPRFLQSYGNLKNFRVTIDIIKKIITSEDTELFTTYLKSGNPAIEDGTFEILCASGDVSLKTVLFNFFEDRVQRVACLKQPECSELYSLVRHFDEYLQKNPTFIDEQIQELKEIFALIKDISSKHLIISILAKCQRSESLDFIKSVYNQETELQEHIIQQLSGNQQAVDFLFEKYHQGQTLKEQVITSLLKSEQGCKYFIQHFFTFDLDKQEIILRNLTFSNQDYLLEFINKIYQSNLYSLKFHLLKVLKENFLFAFKDILFDADHQREFMFMGTEYLETVARLFPISTVKMFYNKISEEDLSNIKIKKYLNYVAAIGAMEPVVEFKDTKMVNRLFNRIINAINVELNVEFFSSFENIKILDLQSYRHLLEAVNTFVEVRAANITEKEKGIVEKLKKRLREQLTEIRDIEHLPKELNAIFANKPIDRERLEKYIETNHIAVALKIHHVVAYLCSRFNNPNIIKKDDQELFHVKFPFITELMKLQWEKGVIEPSEDWTDVASRQLLLKHFPKYLRVVVAFKSKGHAAFIRDQLNEILPEFQVLGDNEIDLNKFQWNPADIFICDAAFLKQFLDKKSLKTARLYLYLESRMDFAPFREYSPKVFMKPLSGYRVVRLILQDLFLHK